LNTGTTATHILVVEDDVNVRTFLIRALARIKPGARISEAENGAEALQLFNATQCDLIISDHRMPIMSGLDLLIATRRNSAVPFIMISADAEVGQRAVAAGVNVFLGKPIDLSMLRAAVLDLLPD
jgi:CheY-like chemotaxis protein